MRVAIVVWKLFPSFVGGTERHSLHLARALAKLGADVDVICASEPPGYDRATCGFRVIPIGWNAHLPDLCATYLFSAEAGRWLARGHYDVAYGQNLALWRYVGQKKIPCVMNPHGLEPLKVRSPLRRARGWARRLAMRHTAVRSDAVVSLGGRLTDEVQRLLGVAPQSIVVLPAGVDLCQLDRHVELSSTGPTIPWSVLCVARLARNKGVDVLLEAFRLVADKRPTARLYVVGDGPQRRALERRAPPGVTFVGSVPDEELARWFGRANVFALPSRFEGMPGAVLEAMAHRLPIVATDVGATSTMVDADNGVLVSPGNVEELATGILELLGRSAAERAQLGRRSREKVEASFTWDSVGQRTLSFLKQIADRRPARQP